MRIGIIGYGFVGKAMENGIKDNVDIFLVDPILNTKISDLKDFLPEIIFICVPTPMNEDGSQDLSIIDSVLKEIKENSFNSKIVIKSTVLPDGILEIEKLIPDVIYNPEFLREKHAFEDFIRSEIIIFGGQKDSADEIANFYKKHTDCINSEYQFTDLITASMVKYSINTFLSTKVIFFNQIFNIFRALSNEKNWEQFVKIISKDKRIGSSHLSVPGHDGRYGFGGACLPKDSSALINYASSIDEPLTLLEKSVEINNSIRSFYDKETQREIDQSVNFDNKTKD
tara:strand:- start:4165 stop:5016 length:852 start_codon:yes stop_codon:yes gene_type:complete